MSEHPVTEMVRELVSRAKDLADYVGSDMSEPNDIYVEVGLGVANSEASWRQVGEDLGALFSTHVYPGVVPFQIRGWHYTDGSVSVRWQRTMERLGEAGNAGVL